MQRVYTYVLTYIQETRTERANVSKFGQKGGANFLCILPKAIYLHKAMLLDNFAIKKVKFSSLRALLLPSSGWSGRSSSPSVGKTEFSASLIWVNHLELLWGHSRAASEQESDNTRRITNSRKGRRKPTTLGEDALKPITLVINTEALAWHLNWRRRRSEILCNLRRTGYPILQGYKWKCTHPDIMRSV